MHTTVSQWYQSSTTVERGKRPAATARLPNCRKSDGRADGRVTRASFARPVYMTIVSGPSGLALVAVVFAAGGTALGLAIRSFRRAARATSADALRIVLDPAAIAERAEREFTAMLLDGELTRDQYRVLVGALAEDCCSISRPAPSAAKGHRRVS